MLEANEAHSPRPIKGNSRAASRPHLIPGDNRLHEQPTDTAIDGALALKPAPGSWPESDGRAFTESVRCFATLSISRTSLNAGIKRVVDLLGALVLAVVFSPLMLVLVVVLRRGHGSVIYKHPRVGRDGRMFECLKFRTMSPNAEQVLTDLLERNAELKSEWLRDHKLRNDPRITPLGRFLRRTSLDELPQIWNVVRGEMSLVGPRPVVREELLRYGRSIGAYLAAKPGITGLWQVRGRNDTDYRRRVILDTYYVCNHNLLLDAYILFRTIGVVLKGNGAY